MAGFMRIIDILEAQANLEELIDELKPGEWFAISVDGKPKVKSTCAYTGGIQTAILGREVTQRRMLLL